MCSLTDISEMGLHCLHPPSLISVFAVRMKKAWVISLFCHAVAHLWFIVNSSHLTNFSQSLLLKNLLLIGSQSVKFYEYNDLNHWNVLWRDGPNHRHLTF